jgi:hypothetical protein
MNGSSAGLKRVGVSTTRELTPSTRCIRIAVFQFGAAQKTSADKMESAEAFVADLKRLCRLLQPATAATFDSLAAGCRCCCTLAATLFGLFAAIQSFNAALLNRGATSLILGAALQALLAAPKFRVRLTAGPLCFAAGELGRTTVLRLLVAGGSREEKAQGEKRTGDHFGQRKH